jgi:hypothetical protein
MGYRLDLLALQPVSGRRRRGRRARIDPAASAREDGLLYISDRHARGNNAGHPLANLWDNGSDPVDALNDTLVVRQAALNRFGTDVLAQGLPLSEIRNVFPPIYLYHRYQVEAAAKALGGVMFAYEVNGPDVSGVTDYDPDQQRRALEALAQTLEPARLDISDATLALLTPSPFTDYDAIAQREQFETDQYPAFSRANAAAAAGRITSVRHVGPGPSGASGGTGRPQPRRVEPSNGFWPGSTALCLTRRVTSRRVWRRCARRCRTSMFVSSCAWRAARRPAPRGWRGQHYLT